MGQRHPGTPLGVWLGALVATFQVSAAGTPLVRFVEVGDGGVVFAEVALRATVEIATTEPFRGTFVLTHRGTPDASWTKGGRGVHWGDRTRLPLDLRPGTTRLEVEVPSPNGAYSSEGRPPLLELVWLLEDSDGARLASGREVAHPEVAGALRLLRLTSEPGEGFRRAPEAAWETPRRYEPYATVLVSRDTLRGLRERQRQALADAVALGLTLVVTSPGGADGFAPLGPPFDEALSHERVTWTGDAGEETRESRLLWGRIRRTTAAATPPKGDDERALASWMLLTAPRGRPDAHRIYIPLEGFWSGRLPERFRAARLGALSAYAAVAVALLLLFVASKRFGRPPRLPVALAVAVGLAAPAVVYGVLAGRRAGNSDWRFRVTVHDGVGPLACSGTYASRGGGGGSRPVSVSWEAPERGIVAVDSFPSLTFVPCGGRTRRATAATGFVAWFTFVHAFARSLHPPDPLWETDLRWEEGRLIGTLKARREVKDAWFFGLTATDAGHVGAVPAGGRVDVSSMALFRGRPKSADAIPTLRRAWMGRLGSWTIEVPRTYWPVPDFGPSFLVSEEPTTDDGTAVYDYQGLRPAGAPEQGVEELPALVRGKEIHVLVPKALDLPEDPPFLLSSYPWTDHNPSRAGRFETAPDGNRRAVIEKRGGALERWGSLRPDLPAGTGYVAVRWKKGT